MYMYIHVVIAVHSQDSMRLTCAWLCTATILLEVAKKKYELLKHPKVDVNPKGSKYIHVICNTRGEPQHPPGVL